MAAEQFALAGIGFKARRNDAHRDAGGTIHAARAISHALRTAEPYLAERIVQFIGMDARELSENLPFLHPRQIGAGARACHKEARESKLRGHRSACPSGVIFLKMGVWNDAALMKSVFTTKVGQVADPARFFIPKNSIRNRSQRPRWG
jgi:hypothetical protein